MKIVDCCTCEELECLMGLLSPFKILRWVPLFLKCCTFLVLSFWSKWPRNSSGVDRVIQQGAIEQHLILGEWILIIIISPGKPKRSVSVGGALSSYVCLLELIGTSFIGLIEALSNISWAVHGWGRNKHFSTSCSRSPCLEEVGGRPIEGCNESIIGFQCRLLGRGGLVIVIFPI